MGITSREALEWGVRILGHVYTSMIYKIQGRYTPHLTKQDSSAIERQISGSQTKLVANFGVINGYNRV